MGVHKTGQDQLAPVIAELCVGRHVAQQFQRGADGADAAAFHEHHAVVEMLPGTASAVQWIIDEVQDFTANDAWSVVEQHGPERAMKASVTGCGRPDAPPPARMRVSARAGGS